MQQRTALILCTGNSVLSQMTEGLVNHFLKDWQAQSAGTHPVGWVHPLAIEAMNELGIDLGTHRSKSVEEFHEQDFDVVITVCDSAVENCPVWLRSGHKVHIGFSDPAAVQGTLAQQLIAFRRVRDEIGLRLLPYLVTVEK